MMQQNEIAVIMAAGLGERMKPLTERIAKPLIPVCGTPMIETLINALQKRGVSRIYIIVGYKKEQFLYLSDKYKNIKFIENQEYAEKNNISSIKAAIDVLGHENCFICEADLFIKDDSIFDFEFKQSCYFTKFVKGHSDDWVFDVTDDKIVHIHKGGEDLYNLSGVSYWIKSDIQIIADAVTKAYTEPDCGRLFWDEIVNRVLGEVNLSIYPVESDQIIEIDTVDELNDVSQKYC